MRKKIKELMNREEGFTLVELLAVIVILGIIVAIAVPAIGNIIDRAGTDANAAEAALVEDAARIYITTNELVDADWVSNKATISIVDLKADGLLDERGDTAVTTGNVEVTRVESTTSAGTYNYTYNYVE